MYLFSSYGVASYLLRGYINVTPFCPLKAYMNMFAGIDDTLQYKPNIAVHNMVTNYKNNFRYKYLHTYKRYCMVENKWIKSQADNFGPASLQIYGMNLLKCLFCHQNEL